MPNKRQRAAQQYLYKLKYKARIASQGDEEE